LPSTNAVDAAAARYQMNQGLAMPPVAYTPSVTSTMSVVIQIGLRMRRSPPRRNNAYSDAVTTSSISRIATAIGMLSTKTPSACAARAAKNAAM
jgi:hypothetical protein